MLPPQSVQELLLVPVSASVAADGILGQCLQTRCADLFRFVVEHLPHWAYQMTIGTLEPQQNALFVDHGRLVCCLWQKIPTQHKVVAIGCDSSCKAPHLPVPSVRRQIRTCTSQAIGCGFEAY